ncbi:MAG TPA: hypothetical protein VMB85_02970 [Bryobacteraceae bacterium]|jgi:hypothetical protein|nr:hypothetical protein [Bryobacteraceae bacterium]
MRPEHDEALITDEMLSRTLRSLPRRLPPADLTSRLRVAASRERLRAIGLNIAFRDRFRLFFDNLMRPLALPFAGGVFSTVLLFSMCMMPMYSVHASSTSDVPTGLRTDAELLATAPIAASPEDVIVDVTIDREGRMIDYKIVCGNVARDEALRRSIEGTLLLTRFVPATAFGQPVEGRIRLLLWTSYVNVKG